LTNYLKLQILNLLSFHLKGIANVTIGQALTFVMPKKKFYKSFTMIK
jgi:hypothetical protein